MGPRLPARSVVVVPDEPRAKLVVDPDVLHVVGLPALDARRAGIEDVAAVHVHLGLPGPDPVVAGSGATRLVVTLHELTASTVQALRVLAPVTEAVLVPHPLVAATVWRRWGIASSVVPPPPVVLDPSSVGTVARGGGTVVGMYDGSRPLLAAAAAELEVLPDPRLRVVRWSGSVARPSDLAAWVAGLDVLVLAPDTPWAGTWVALCQDLGVRAVLPTGPLEVDPRAASTYLAGATPQVVARSVLSASRQPGVARATYEEQQLVLRRLRERHTRLYLGDIDDPAGRT